MFKSASRALQNFRETRGTVSLYILVGILRTGDGEHLCVNTRFAEQPQRLVSGFLPRFVAVV